MLKKRIIPCLDIRNRKVTKGVKFQNNVDLGDPVEMAVAYSDGGADELVFYDITASAERRRIDIEMVREIGKVIHIPFAVGGGLRTLEDMYDVLDAGAEKVSVNSLAVEDPNIIGPTSSERCRARSVGRTLCWAWTRSGRTTPPAPAATRSPRAVSASTRAWTRSSGRSAPRNWGRARSS